MIKFEKIEEKEEEVEEIVEGKPFLDKDGKMKMLLKSNIRCIFDPEFDNGNHVLSAKLAEMVHENKIYVSSRLLDYCPGYGSIGLDMLALGTTNHVVFVDTTEHTVLNCLETSKNHSILFHTTGYCIDTIADLPENEKYDVIVATMNNDEDKMKDFFEHIYKYCTIHADIYLIESKDNDKIKNSNYMNLNNIYYIKSFTLEGKVVMHYKLNHDHLK
jgi:hypothetical protein